MCAVKNVFCIVTMMACVWLGFTSDSRGELVIAFEEIAGDGVQVSWSGSGTFNFGTSSSGPTLNFNNFGDIFGTGIADDVFTLPSTLTLSGTLNDMTTFQYVPNAIQLGNSLTGNGGDDVDFLNGTSIVGAGTFTASGSSIVTNLQFSDLIPGSYTASNTSGDGDGFSEADETGNPTGVVTLNIVALTAVPEPTSLMMFGSVVVPYALRRRRRRF